MERVAVYISASQNAQEEEAAFEAELVYGRERGVSGVPHFFIAGDKAEVSLGGAQPPETLASSILRAAGLAV